MRAQRPSSVRQLALYLIKPSNYDEEGYVIRYWRGVLPSNTLSCLYGLTEDVRVRGALGKGLRWRIRLIDEAVQRVDVNAILRHQRRAGVKVVVCLVGVQSNQFARASDLALMLRQGGVDVLIGGFHVSGSLAVLPQIPPEIQRLLHAGVSVVAGEIEGRWEDILRDALEGRLRGLYHFLREPPSLDGAPLPRLSARYLRRFVAPNFGTLDCGRGCPFNCSFCTVINVQGRAMRFRDVATLCNWIRDNYRRRRICSYFFTDDNFCRNRNWEAIFDGLIRLRREEGLRVGFMMQVDSRSYLLPRFIDKAKAAGCSQVFIGLESLNARNLEAAGKRQNRVADFRALIEAYRSAGINTHVAYIIGFPFDTVQSVRADLRRLRDEVAPEQASFFVLTPLPGSMDHLRQTEQGAALEPDLNRYDSFHVAAPHPRMSREEWSRTYEEAWRSFYSLANMTRILQRVSVENYWAVFANFIWYKNATEVERGHPMVHGFFRLKGRRSRRLEAPLESRWRYVQRRWRDLVRYARLWPRLALEMEELWLRTRKRSALEERVIEELKRFPASVRGWRRMRVEELRLAYRRAARALAQKAPQALTHSPLSIPPRLALWVRRWNPLSHALTCSRWPLRRFWASCRTRLRRGEFHRLSVSSLAFHAAQEVSLFAIFATLFFSRLLVRLFARKLAGT